MREVAHEGAVDFHHVHGQRLEVTEGGVARTEIVDRHLAAKLAHGRDETRRIIEVVQRRGFGNLDDKPFGKVPAVLQARDQRAQPAAVGRGDAGDIEREHDVRVALQIAEREIEYEPVEGAHQAEAFDHGHEFTGCNDAAVMRIHAQQTFIITHLVAGGVDDGLIGEDQAILLDRLGYLFAQLHVVAASLPLLLGHPISLRAIAPGGLGLQERALGFRDDVEAGPRLLGEKNDTDRDGDVDPIAADHDRGLPDRVGDALGDGHRVRFRADAEYDSETVAAQAADHIGFAQALIETLSNLDQNPVSSGATVGHVDAVELIESDRQEGTGLVVALAASQGVIERFAQAQLVEVAGQLVVVGELLELGFVLLALGNQAHGSR